MQLLKNMHYKCATLYGLDTETHEMNSGKPNPESNVLRENTTCIVEGQQDYSFIVAIQYWQRYFYDGCNLGRGPMAGGTVELQSRMEERILVDT